MKKIIPNNLNIITGSDVSESERPPLDGGFHMIPHNLYVITGSDVTESERPPLDRGFHMISRLHFFFFFTWRSVRAHQFHSLGQIRSTVAHLFTTRLYLMIEDGI